MHQPNTTSDSVPQAFLAKSKKQAMTTLMKATNTERPIEHNQPKTKPPARKEPSKTQAKATSKARNHNKLTTPNKDCHGNTKEPKKSLTAAIIHLCGCRHGDLSALKSFNKANVKYYTRPHQFLENQSCLDCKQAMGEMKPVGPRQGAVVFYCDEGIKGFSAPDDDPMKEELTCDLILCPQCEARRRITFDKAEESGRKGSGRKRNRH